MYCKNCGKELSENAFVCPDCGEPVNAASQRVNAAAKPTVCGKNGLAAVTGFIGSLVSVVCWVCFLCIVLCGYSYLPLMGIVLGIVTGLVCLVSLFLSIAGLISDAEAGKNRAFPISGVVLSATFFTGFLLLTCIVGCIY